MYNGRSKVTCPTAPVITRSQPGTLEANEGELRITYALVEAAPVSVTRTVLVVGKVGGVNANCATMVAGNAR